MERVAEGGPALGRLSLNNGLRHWHHCRDVTTEKTDSTDASDSPDSPTDAHVATILIVGFFLIVASGGVIR